MADNVEEFLLRYKIDVAEASRKLDQLNEKLDRTGKKGKASAAGLGSEFMGAAKKVAAAGTAIVLAWKAVMNSIRAATDAMKDYNEQAIIARKTGIGMQTQEAIAANMSRGSGGRVSRAESRQALNAIGEFVGAAYTDPSRMNAQNVRLRMMGISPTGANGMIAGTGSVMDQLGKRWKDMTEEMARAEGDLLGLTTQTVDAMRQLGGAVTDTSNITLEQAKRQRDASAAAKELNAALDGIEKDFGDIVKVITDDVLPILANFFKLLQEGSHNLAGVFSKEGIVEGGKHAGRALWEDFKARVGAGKDDKVPSFSEQLDATGKKQTEEEQRQAQAIVDQDTKNAELNHEASKKLELTANQFSMAVAAMPGAVSMEQAIAMWAGEAAKRMLTGGAPAAAPAAAGGTTAPAAGGATRGIRNKNPGNLEYNAYTRSLGATGSDGRFAIFPTMEAGVKAHETLLGGKSYAGKTLSGIINKYAPSSENDTKAYIDFVSKRTGIGAGDVVRPDQIPALAAAMQVHESRYTGGGGAGAGGVGRGYGRSDYQRVMAGSGIASQLHMTGDPLRVLSDASRGDVQYAIDAQMKGFAASIVKLQGEINAAEARHQPQVAASLKGDLFRQAQQMQALDTYSSQFLAGARPGGQERTQGSPPIQTFNININGITDPMEVAKEVQRQMGIVANKVANDSDSHRTN